MRCIGKALVLKVKDRSLWSIYMKNTTTLEDGSTIELVSGEEYLHAVLVKEQKNQTGVAEYRGKFATPA